MECMTPQERAAMAHRAYMQAIQPYIDVKVRIYNMHLPTIKLYPSGKIEREYNLSDQEKETLNNLDALIKTAQDSFYPPQTGTATSQLTSPQWHRG